MLTPARREQVRLAQDLEKHLPPFHRPEIWMPDFHWDRMRSTQTRLEYVMRHNWSAAVDAAVVDLASASQSLITQVRSSCDTVARQFRPPPRATLREILQDLEALEGEFEDVRWDRRDKILSVVTDSVVLTDVALGRFEIVLDYEHLSRQQPYRVIALDPNPAAGHDTTTHPHVRDETLCEGDGRTSIRQALHQGRFLDFFVLIRQILTSYNSHSPYVALAAWNGMLCRDCGTRCDEDDMSVCERCESSSCSDCSRSCSRCSTYLCSGCSGRCGDCGDSHCPGCLTNCPGCHDEYCEHCLENGRCQDCQETETDEEEEAETYESQPAVQSVGLGEAAVPEGSGTD